MGRRRRKRSKDEILISNIFELIGNIIKTIFIILHCIIKGLIEGAKLLRSVIKNIDVYRRIGFTPSDVNEYIDEMSPREFEHFCARLFKLEGYTTKVTESTNDYGRDIIMKKGEETTFVECKHFKRSKVGREICQKLLRSVSMFDADKGIIITSGYFHNNAYEVARMVDNLILVDRGEILRRLFKMGEKELKSVLIGTNMSCLQVVK